MRPWPELALGRMRAKIGDLSMVLEGRFDEPHALMCRLHLQHLDLLDQRLATGAPSPPGDTPRADSVEAEQEALTSVRRATALLTLSQSRYGVGLLSDAELIARMRELTEQIATAAAKAQAAEQDKDRFAREGGGRAERELLAKRERLAEQVRLAEAAAQAAGQLRQARQSITETRQQLEALRQREQSITSELDTLRPWNRARRRELDTELSAVRDRQARQQERLNEVLELGTERQQTARQAAEHAPAQVTWPLVRSRHADLERDFDSAQRGARSRDVTEAALRAQEARAAQAGLQQELATLKEEETRRVDLPPDRRDIERAARAEHAQRQREVAIRQGGPVRSTPELERERERQQPNRPSPGRSVDHGPGLSR
ncbi:hypothetical protein [Nonomuraea sp. NPDC049480]|uniref:hypothetical protein n=1 Tax=Nonomuraea sp. NPDC049480 TaxID=3364353 RepID=UPI0037A3A479